MGVGQIVSGSAAGLIFVGAILAVVISIIQEWVVVSLPFDEACSTNPLGKLGLYHATFDPACVAAGNYTDSTKQKYAQFNRSESATTEFWPLFPSTTKFGGFFGPSIELPDFTNCEDFYNSPATQKAFVAGGVQAATGVFAQVDAKLAPKFTELHGAVDLLTNAVKGIWSSKVSDSFDTLIVAVNEKIIATEVKLLGALTLYGQGALLNNSVPNPNFLVSRSNLTSPIVLSNTNASDAAIFAGALSAVSTVLYDATNVTTTAYVNILLNLNAVAFASKLAPGNATKIGEFAQGFGLVQAIAGNLVSLNPPIVQFNLVGFTTSTSFTILQSVLDQIAANPNPLVAGISTVSFYPARALMHVCSKLLNVTTPQACISGYNGKPLQENLTAPSPLCTLLLVAPNSTLASFDYKAPGNTDAFLINLIKNKLVAIPGLDANYAAILDGVAPVLSNCAANGIPLSSCLFGPDASYRNVPSDFSRPYPLCLGVKIQSPTLPLPCTNFTTFLNIAVLQEPALGDFIKLINVCVATGTVTRDQCVLKLGPVLKNLVSSAFIDGDNVTAQIAACNDDVEDARRIKLAQVLTPVGTALDFIAVGLAAVLILKSNAIVGVVGAVLAVTGGVLVLVALLQVKGAPVYQKVGGDKKLEVAYYKAGLAETLGYIAIFAPLLGGIALGVGSFLIRKAAGSSESQVATTSKVEGEAAY